MQVSIRATADLLGMAAPYNPRKISPHDFEALRRSLRYFGTVEPIIVNARSGHIVGGHQRVKAAEAESILELPVVEVDLDAPSEKQLNIALNRISGQWDDAKLREVLIGLERDGADLILTGMEDDELKRLLQHVTEGQTAPDDLPSEVPQRVSPGQLWQLGRHRLACGDSEDAETIRRLYDSDHPRLCVTDPPYGVNYDPSWRNEAAERGELDYAPRRTGAVENDERADWSSVFRGLGVEVLYSWCAAGETMIEAGRAVLEAGFEIRASIIWRKPHFPISRGHYTFQHEPCWYAVRKGGKAHWIGDATASTVWEVSLDQNVPGGHSTQKPVDLFRRAIANHDGDVVDPFCGSGTCLIAAEQLGRRCFAVELKPGYCDVILARWEAFTGQESKKL